MFERGLMEAVASGDERARNSLVAAHYVAISRFVGRLTFGHEEARDLTQQTFIQATAKASTFRAECSLRSWLRGIAYHEYTHWLRRNERDVAPLTEVATGGSGYADAVVLYEAISSISPLLRESFLLREVVGLSIQEAAELLGCPAGTVKFRVHAAKAALRKLLAEPEDTYENQADRSPDPSRCSSA